MKTPALHSPFIDGEVLGQAAGNASFFEGVMPEPRPQAPPAIAASGLHVVNAQGQPLAGVGWAVHQGTLTLSGMLDAVGETGSLDGGKVKLDRSKPFRLHVAGHVCSIVSGAVLVVDDPAVEYGGALFDWHEAEHADAARRQAFWQDYAQRRGQNPAPAAWQFLQHDHVMRRPLRWLKGTAMPVFQAQPLAIRLGPLVRYTDHQQALIWLELQTPGLVRVRYGAAADPRRKPAAADVPPASQTQHACSVRVGGRHFCLVKLEGLPADSVVQYTVELAPQPATGPLPATPIDFSEATFPAQLPAAALQPQQQALKRLAYAGSCWLYLRTLAADNSHLRFAHGSCRVYPGDADKDDLFPGHDMLERFGNAFLPQRGLDEWPRFFMHSGDQIYADDIGKALGHTLVLQRHAATLPGPHGPDNLARGAWAGRYAMRCLPRSALLPPPPQAALDTVRLHRLSFANPALIEDAIERAELAVLRQALHAGVGAPPQQKYQVRNQLLWQVPVQARDMPKVDVRRGLLMPQTFRVKGPQAQDVRLAHPAAGDTGGVHAADFAEYAAAYEQAWRVHGARQALAHLPSYMIFDDHEVTDDWNADPGWLASVHDPADTLRMWPLTITDALVAYWVYQGWGNLAPAVAAADPRVQILDSHRHSGLDALPALRRLVHARAVLPTKKGVDRSKLLAWSFAVPTGGTPFLAVDLRTDRDVNGKGGMSDTRLRWLETVLRAARTPAAFIVLPVPMLMPAPMMFAMRNPGIPAFITSALSTRAFQRSSDLEHPAMNLVWDQIKGLLQTLQKAGSPLKTLVIVSGDIHFSCNLDAQLPQSRLQPRLLQLVSSGLRKTISDEKQGQMRSAYRGPLNALSGSKGIDEHRGLVMTLGGVKGPGQQLDNFVFPTSFALVDVRPAVGSPRGQDFGRMALVQQLHYSFDARVGLVAREFRHMTRDGASAVMTLHDPGPAVARPPSRYPRGQAGVGLVHEAEFEDVGFDAAEAEAEAGLDANSGEFVLQHHEADVEEAEAELLWDEAEDGEPEAQSDGEAVSSEDEVIGSDGRTRVARPGAVPWRWVCALDAYFDATQIGPGTQSPFDHTRATGILIGPRHVLTAAHVVRAIPVNGQYGAATVPSSRIRVSPGRCGSNRKSPFGEATSTRFHVSAPYEETLPAGGGRSVRVRRQDDMALIVLDKDLADTRSGPQRQRLGYWGEDAAVASVRAIDPADLRGQRVTVVGYPGDTCGGKPFTGSDTEVAAAINRCRHNPARAEQWAAWPWQGAGVAADAPGQPAKVYYSADTYHGQSGAPVLRSQGAVCELVAVHSGPLLDGSTGRAERYNIGVRVTRRMLDELVGWINHDAGKPVARVLNNRLVFDAATTPSREAEAEAEAQAEPLLDEAPEPEALQDDEAPAADRGARQLQRAASKLDQGLRRAAAVLERQPAGDLRDLLDFCVSLLRAHFFPRGHGLVDASGKVLKTSGAGRIAMPVVQADGVRMPFEHRVRLWLSARTPERLRVAGTHSDAHFSSITLYSAAFEPVSASAAAGAAVHETVHMLFTLVDRLRQRHGDAVARRFLGRAPWRLLDMQPLEEQRRQLQAQLGVLAGLLRLPESAAELAASLLEEACAYTLGQRLASAIDAAAAGRGPRVAWQSVGVTELLLRHYVLERSARWSALRSAPELDRVLAQLRPTVDALVDALRARWGAAAPAATPELAQGEADEAAEAFESVATPEALDAFETFETFETLEALQTLEALETIHTADTADATP